MRLLPAALVMYLDGFPAAQEPKHELNIFVLTESLEYDTRANKNANLELDSQIALYIKNNYVYLPHDPNNGAGTYEINRETLQARTVLQRDRFCIVQIMLNVFDRTE